MKLYNTLTRQLQDIKPGNSDGILRVYSCGPTVYSKQHLGHFRAYINWDIFYRSLIYLGFKVKRIMNITDVGHLTSDDDWGEDKLEVGAKKAGKDPHEIADHYIKEFLIDLKLFNVLTPSGQKIPEDMSLDNLKEYGWTRATQYIDSMVELNKQIEANGYAYDTDQALYFDVTKYPEYTKLSGQKLEEKLSGARDDVNVDEKKKSPADFVIWMKKVGPYANHLLSWPSPWGEGFPGWHLECSAMGYSELGDIIDVHTGGVDHIGTHHTNEIAQNFGAHGKDIVNVWAHNEHLQNIDGDKLARSSGDSINQDDLAHNGFSPMDFRYMIASINYRMPIRFSMEALEGSKNARKNLIQKLQLLNTNQKGEVIAQFKENFIEAISDNLNMSGAFAVISEVLKSDEKPENIVATVLDFDKVLGLELESELKISDDSELNEILSQREQARKSGDFAKSDELREKILSLGYTVLDTADGQKISKVN